MTRRGFLKSIVGVAFFLLAGKLFASRRGGLIFNETGEKVYRGYISGRTPEQIASDLVAEYDVDFQTALRDTREFIGTLRAMGV